MHERIHGPVLGLGFSPAAAPILERLSQAGVLDERRLPVSAGENGDTRTWLAQRWPSAGAVVAVAACGLVVRLIAPLLRDKNEDPAVVVVDPQGRWAVPLLGGHAAGGEALAQTIAALLDGQAVLTGDSATAGRLALDTFGSAWGWCRGDGDWSTLMAAAARGAAGEPVRVRQEGGSTLWQGLEAAAGLETAAAGEPADLVIGPWRGEGCRWHPPCLWLGMGCERDTDLTVLERLVDRGLKASGLAAGAVAGLASVDRKGNEPALLALAERRGWPLQLFSAAELAGVEVPHPSQQVAREMGTASVAEAAALRAAAGGAERLRLTKTIERAAAGERGAATLAIAETTSPWAPARGELHLVGSGPGRLDLLSGDARRALADTTIWVGYGLYLDLLEPLRRPDQLRREGRLTEERARCAEALALACQGARVALISSGDSGIYGMAGLALELWLELPEQDRPPFTVHPGLSALQLAAARVGAPLMHDFCTISLSDRLTPWEVIEDRLRAAAAGDFVVALYNPRSRGRDWQLERARQLLLEGRSADTPVAVARQLGRAEERVELHSLGALPVAAVDMLTLVLVGNRSSYVRDGRMVTPRGYPGAELA
ncbi:MAG: precorrin-3B C(17)-methyltransferase [Cyanobacteriota bacterium]|nr:precorrin-3B C(17)-methyltransferase [Cyanobacteriota bacterium]